MSRRGMVVRDGSFIWQGVFFDRISLLW